jgi:hypothetical protein
MRKFLRSAFATQNLGKTLLTIALFTFAIIIASTSFSALGLGVLVRMAPVILVGLGIWLQYSNRNKSGGQD